MINIQILSKYPGLVHNEKVRLGVTTNVAWYFYANKRRWSPRTWLHHYDTLHLLIGHREDIDPRLGFIKTPCIDTSIEFRYEEAKVFDDENIKWLDMNVAMFFRYYWYGTFDMIKNGTKINMEEVNRRWLSCDGDHRKFIPIQY